MKKEVIAKVERNHVLFEWESPARLYKKRGREYFSTILAIVFLVTVVLLVLREFLLIGVVFTLTFFVYVLATVEPPKVKNQLTKKGIRVFKSFFRWEELSDYWVESKYGYAVIHIAAPLRNPGKVILLVDTQNLAAVVKILSDKLVYHKTPAHNWLDRAAEWLAHKIRFESAKLASR